MKHVHMYMYVYMLCIQVQAHKCMCRATYTCTCTLHMYMCTCFAPRCNPLHVSLRTIAHSSSKAVQEVAGQPQLHNKPLPYTPPSQEGTHTIFTLTVSNRALGFVL